MKSTQLTFKIFITLIQIAFLLGGIALLYAGVVFFADGIWPNWSAGEFNLMNEKQLLNFTVSGNGIYPIALLTLGGGLVLLYTSFKGLYNLWFKK